MFCSKCGAKLNEDARFCPKCGSPVMATTPNEDPANNIDESRQRMRRILFVNWNDNERRSGHGSDDERGLVVGICVSALLIYMVLNALFEPLVRANHGELPEAMVIGGAYVSTVGVIIILALGMLALIVAVIAAIKFLIRK